MKKELNKTIIQVDKDIHRQLLILKSTEGHKNISDVIKTLIIKNKEVNELS